MEVGEIMSKEDLLLKLEEPFERIHDAVSAMELMVYGLSQVKNPYAAGFQMVWSSLREADLELQRAMKSAGE